MPIIFCPNSCTTPRLSPKVNNGLWVILMGQCRFILSKTYTILVRDVDNGGGCACVGAGSIWVICVPSPQFCGEPKTLFKK